VQRLAIATVAALAAALAVVSLSTAASHRAQRAPHRIVSLSPTVTEDLFAIGAGTQVVAVDQDSNYPRRAPRTSLSGYTPNVEAIANYHPDLVLISYNPGHFASQLKKLGIRVVSVPAANDLAQAYKEILRLGRLTGHTKGANAVVDSMRTRLAAIVRSVPGSRHHLRVYHELEQTYYSATSNTFIGSISSCSASETSPTARTRRGTAIRSSRPNTSTSGTHRSSSSPTRRAASRRPRLWRPGPVGTRSRPFGTTGSSGSTTTWPPVGARGSSSSRGRSPGWPAGADD
jgi:hypothetical protein